MPLHLRLALLLILAALLACACQKQDEPPPSGATQPSVMAEPKPGAKAGAGTGTEALPFPPVKEDFEGAPQVSLFPRIGDFSPEEDDKESEALWATFIDHLLRASGPVKVGNETRFAFRSLADLNSVGFFLPLAVKPETAYRVSFKIWANIPEGGESGAGILEFDEFLWIGYQYPRSLSEQHFQRAQTGVKLLGDHKGTTQSFTFRTGPQTRMIHLVFFREGVPSRDTIAIDDIEIREN